MAEEAPEPKPEADNAPSRPRRRARLAPIIAASALAGVLLLALLALWLSGEQLTGLLLGGGGGLDAEKVEVDAQTYKEYFTVERKLAGPRGRTLILTLKRTKAFPLKDVDFETLAERTAKSLSALLALEALARGYVRCQYFAAKNDYLGFTFERIEDLRAREVTELALPIASYRGVQRVVIRY